MALIGKIRNNPLIVLLFIGGGIALFIFSEMTNGAGGGPIGPLDQAMARIGQTEINRNDFERTLSGVYRGGDAMRNRDELFNFYVSEGLVQNEADALGLGISEEEETQMLFGATPSQAVQQLVRGRDGNLDRAMLSRIQGYVEAGPGTLEEAARNPENQLNPNLATLWKYTERLAKRNRLQEKMTALVAKGMYAPKWQAETYANEQLKSRQVAVVKVPFDAVADDAVGVSDTDLQAFIDENRSAFDSPEETRTLSYVTFPVVPTAADSAKLRTTMEEIKADWLREQSTEGDSLYAVANRGTYSPTYQTADAFSELIADAVINQMEAGSIYGPYTEGDAYKLVKLVDRKVMADSARIRLIERRAVTPDQVTEASALLDSLQTVLNASPGKWGELAEEFSQNPFSSSNGGRLNNVKPGEQVRGVDDIVFRTGTTGKIYKVTTPGSLFLVEVVRRSASTSTRAKVAYITEPIVPSSETEDAVLAEAQSFLAGKDDLATLKSAAEAAGMEVQTTEPLLQSNFTFADLGSGQQVRDIMCFAFGADAGDVSGIAYTFTDPQLFYENNYVLVGVEDVVPEGVAPLAAVRESILPAVRNRKKGEVVNSAVAGKDLAAIAAQYEVSIDTVRSNPTLVRLPKVGPEPKVVAAAAAVSTGSLSEAIVGNDGIFFLVPLSEVTGANSGNLPAARQQLNLTARQQVSATLLTSLRATADFEDGRPALECR